MSGVPLTHLQALDAARWSAHDIARTVNTSVPQGGVLLVRRADQWVALIRAEVQLGQVFVGPLADAPTGDVAGDALGDDDD